MIDKIYGKFVYGFIGGTLPTIATMAGTYVKVPETDMPTFGLYFGIFLYAVVGGIITMAFVSTHDIKQAVTTGIAAPALIANLVAGANGAAAEKVSSNGWFISSAYAQGQEPIGGATVGSKNNILIFTPLVSGQVPSDRVQVYAVGAGGAVSPLGQISNFKGMTAIEIPDGVSVIQVGGDTLPVDKKITRVNLAIESQPTFYNDLMWAFGAPRKYGIKKVDIQEKE